MRTAAHHIEHMIKGLLCLSLVLWSLGPTSAHAYPAITTVQEHLEIIAEHGHSHGIEEDILWAMHGHSHDGADHDHAHMILIGGHRAKTPPLSRDLWPMGTASLRGARPNRIERPPRM